jgi:tripartite-type tricarboxylate transporter receptor subunit TctC
MTHLGSGVCIAAVETMLICVGRGEQSSFLPRPSQRRIATRSSVKVLLPLIKEGRLRAVAVTSESRWPELPDVPTMAESGITGMPAHIWFGLLAPARTPEPIIAKLNAAVNEGLKIPEMQASIAKLGMETSSFTAQEFADRLVEEERAWAAAIRESGIKID